MGNEETIGRRLLLLRKELGLTQQEVADQLGLSVRGWQKIERDEAVPSGDTLLRLEAIGYNPGWVLSQLGPKLKRDAFSHQQRSTHKITPAVFRAVKKLVREIYDTAGIRLPDDARDEEAVRWYNELTGMARGDSEEGRLRSLLPALEYEIKHAVEKAAAEPGTGKASA